MARAFAIWFGRLRHFFSGAPRSSVYHDFSTRTVSVITQTASPTSSTNTDFSIDLSPILQNVFRWTDSHHYCPERRSVCPAFEPKSALPLIKLAAGTDTSQGKGQIISNINACLAVQATIKSTLGPYGGDLLMVDANGKQTITNDGATVMKVRRTGL